ncbi:hypothetical protein J6590_042077 [Homalodisca vitripennis]|nr:hypothetical protein J6590_042077 [Homalodisca vitripennis]
MKCKPMRTGVQQRINETDRRVRGLTEEFVKPATSQDTATLRDKNPIQVFLRHLLPTKSALICQLQGERSKFPKDNNRCVRSFYRLPPRSHGFDLCGFRRAGGRFLCREGHQSLVSYRNRVSLIVETKFRSEEATNRTPRVMNFAEAQLMKLTDLVFLIITIRIYLDILIITTRTDLDILVITTRTDLDILIITTRADLEIIIITTRTDLYILINTTRTDLDILIITTRADLDILIITRTDLDILINTTRIDLEILIITTRTDLDILINTTRIDLDILIITTRTDLEILINTTRTDLDILIITTRTDLEILIITTRTDLDILTIHTEPVFGSICSSGRSLEQLRCRGLDLSLIAL